jgi:divalent metal cation (Fe/Co/Zn/Cd) transporter
MNMPETVRDDAADRRAANRAIAVSAAGLAVTAAVEFVLAVFTGSVALLGDALHNLSDVSTSAVVFVGFWISRRPATARYPYGYERARGRSSAERRRTRRRKLRWPSTRGVSSTVL